jgi:hypothetical protein
MTLSRALGAIVLAAGLVLWPSDVMAQRRAERSVVDTERGGFFTYPFAGEWSAFGASIGRRDYEHDQMGSTSLRGLHGRLQHFADVDEPPSGFGYFPWKLLEAYDASEVARGRTSLQITAMHQGKARPVYFSYGDFSREWPFRALNVRDERYARFFVQQYARAQLLEPALRGEQVIGADNCTFKRDLYGVLDDQDRYVKDVPWQTPYPQSDTEWVDSVVGLLRGVKRLAPDIRILCNEIGLNEAQEARLPEVAAELFGVIREEFWYFGGGKSDWFRDAFYKQMTRMEANGAAGMVEIHQVPLAPTDEIGLRRSFLTHLLVAGPNFFFGPKDTSSRELNPELWASMRNRLGRPVGPMKSEREPGKASGSRVYLRELEGGVAVLNWTGAPKTITLPPAPAGKVYLNRNGVAVKAIALDDMAADYVTYATGERAPWPSISPRVQGPVSGPVRVTLGVDPRFGKNAMFRYTLDGTEPTASSTEYTGPFTLTQSAVVRAKAFGLQGRESFTNDATYVLSATKPAVSFHLAEDETSELFPSHHVLVALSHASSEPVTVRYSVTGGTATRDTDFTLNDGSLTFEPGERFMRFTVAPKDDAAPEFDESVELTLSEPAQATLGTTAKQVLWIRDREKGGMPPAATAPAPGGANEGARGSNSTIGNRPGDPTAGEEEAPEPRGSCSLGVLKAGGSRTGAAFMATWLLSGLSLLKRRSPVRRGVLR